MHPRQTQLLREAVGQFPKKPYRHSAQDPAIPLEGGHPGELKTDVHAKLMSECVQKLRTRLPHPGAAILSFRRRRREQTVVWSHNEMPVGDKKRGAV